MVIIQNDSKNVYLNQFFLKRSTNYYTMRLLNNPIFFLLITTGICFNSCKEEQKTEINQEPLVKTAYGEVEGSPNDSVYAFKGIPYAKADRFMPPQRPDTWEETLECKDFGPVAKQVVAWIPDSTQNEKKLFNLNVWTQGIKDGKKRPVMVWLHGGGFHIGSSNDPMTYGEALAKKGDVVMVSVNHRLNILGFLDLS